MTDPQCYGQIEAIDDRCYRCAPSPRNYSCPYFQHVQIHTEEELETEERENLVPSGLERFLKKYPDWRSHHETVK